MSSESERPIFVSADDTLGAGAPVASASSQPPRAVRRRRRRPRIKRISLVLFLVTCVSTFFAGFLPGGLGGALNGWSILFSEAALQQVTRATGESLSDLIWNGVTFGGCLMSILLAHEMGHYLLAKFHRIPATPPFFIPMPVGPFGTMGAVIFQDASKANRRQLFDIAIAGPLAGLVIAIPVLVYGVTTSELVQVRAGAGTHYGDPLLVEWIVAAIHGVHGPNEDIGLNPALFAGWVGVFITALNLVPVGQLDGGHILYTLVRRRAHTVAVAVILGALAWMVFSRRMDYALILILLLFFGPIHPPTADDHVPLGLTRHLLGWLTLAFIIIGFTPTPIIG